MEKQKNNNEIDLLELFQKIFKVLKKYSLLIIAFFLLAFAYGIYKTVKSEPFYETQMIARSAGGNNTAIELLTSLSELVSQRNIPMLKNKFMLDTTTLKSLKYMECIDLQEERKYSGFAIKIQTTRKTAIDSIQTGIEYFLSNNPYIKKQIEIDQKHLEEYLDKTNKTLSVVDSLKRVKGTNQQNNFYIEEQSYADQIMKLMNKKGALVNNLEFNEALIVIDDFSIPEKPQKNIKINLIVYPFIGIVLGVIISFVVYFIKKISTY